MNFRALSFLSVPQLCLTTGACTVAWTRVDTCCSLSLFPPNAQSFPRFLYHSFSHTHTQLFVCSNATTTFYNYQLATIFSDERERGMLL
ncbi:MAG: hypothetical protein J3R72DRAFT_444695 [Linnemannia gamsii]|nr:MAG: hypothetical protein J3R72DRAFT_444695 [Linnemannia gamsii]